MSTNSSRVNPQPGDFAAVPMHGAFGKLVEFGEWLNGTGFDRYQHAIVYVGDGMMVQAEPGGAQLRPLKHYEYSLWSTGLFKLDDMQVAKIVSSAKELVGTPYSFLDYAAIAAHRLHLPIPGLRGYVSSSEHMICSQLVDYCYQAAGIQLFPDGRWNGYVTPADLAKLIVARGGLASSG